MQNRIYIIWRTRRLGLHTQCVQRRSGLILESPSFPFRVQGATPCSSSSVHIAKKMTPVSNLPYESCSSTATFQTCTTPGPCSRGVHEFLLPYIVIRGSCDNINGIRWSSLG